MTDTHHVQTIAHQQHTIPKLLSTQQFLSNSVEENFYEKTKLHKLNPQFICPQHINMNTKKHSLQRLRQL